MKHIMLLSVLLLGVAWAVAQDTTTPSSSPNSQTSGQSSQSASSQMDRTSSGSHTSVEGCLGGSDGKYTLTDKQGTTYNLTGDTSKLAEHVGHEVKITGSVSAGTGSASGSATSGENVGNAGSQTLEITSVKHVSKTCQNAGGMTK